MNRPLPAPAGDAGRATPEPGPSKLEAVSAAAAKKMKVADLKKALKARGVSAAGKKADLVARLAAWSPVGALAGKRSPTKTPNPKRAKVKKSKPAKVKNSKPAKKAALTTLEAVAAAAAAGARLEELRIDPTDGRAYNKQSFIAVYGGTAQWDAAPGAMPSPPVSTSAPATGRRPRGRRNWSG